MGNRDIESFSCEPLVAEERNIRDRAGDDIAKELSGGIAYQLTGQEPGVDEYLKAVTDAENSASLFRIGVECRYDGRTHRLRAWVYRIGPSRLAVTPIAEGESAWDNEDVCRWYRTFSVPKEFCLMAKAAEEAQRIKIAVRAGEAEHKRSDTFLPRHDR